MSLLISPIFIKTIIFDDDVDNNEDSRKIYNEESLLKSSGFWNLTGTPIFIDDWKCNYNWEKISSENEWCSGSGTLQDPYIIKNVIIDGKNSGSCITIRNSDVYFIIKDCILYNSGWSHFNWASGIKLINTNNGLLLNNNCSHNRGYGILQIRCFNNNLSGNIVNYNSRHGLFCWRSDNNIIIENEISFNEINGIYFWSCDINNITGNKINYNQNGINLLISNNNFITGNYLVGNNVSIYQFRSFGNIIKNNIYEYEPPPPDISDEKVKGGDDGDDDGDSEITETQDISYISYLIVGITVGIVSGGIIGYIGRKTIVERKKIIPIGKSLKGKPKAESFLGLEEDVKPELESEFLPKKAIIKFEDIKKLNEKNKGLENNLSENEKN